MTRQNKRVVTILILVVMLASFLTSCSAPAPTADTTGETKQAEVQSVAVQGTGDTPVAIGVPPSPDEVIQLDEQQRNSITMLNFLSVLAQEVNFSSCSRMRLEELYSSLLSNIHPNAIDGNTLYEINDMLDTLEAYRMIDVKRERLAYLHEQNKAQAIHSAIPNPLILLSAVGSQDYLGLITSVLFMAVDSISSYTSHMNEADMTYLQDNWQLDDEAAAQLHRSRKSTFSYMVNIVSEYGLPGDLALSEQDVDEFVTWANHPNPFQRIQFLESNSDRYQALGQYWIVLAESYYEVQDYESCLHAITCYEELDIRLFRKDYDYARLLPMAIVSCGYLYTGEEYVQKVCIYAENLLDNTDYSGWELRYFVAQTYVDLYGRTGDITFLQTAYAITLDNVNVLVEEQRNQNAVYLAPVVIKSVPEDATKAEKKDIKNYNQYLKNERITELPPVYQPLRLNCELLFALADELQITEEEKLRITRILYGEGERLFLCETMERMFNFEAEPVAVADIAVSFDGKKLLIPAQYVTDGAALTVKVMLPDATEPVVIDDWKIKEVHRETEGELSSFTAEYTSETVREIEYIPGTVVHIELLGEGSTEPLVMEYRVDGSKTLLVFNSVEFQRTK